MNLLLRAVVPFMLTALALAGCDACQRPVTAPAVEAPPSLARLAGLKGKVTLEREGRARPAAEEAIFARDAVETGPAAEAVLNFADGRVVELGPDARLIVGEDASGLVLEVERGVILSRVPAGSDGKRVELKILTPFGLTRLGDGQSEVTVAVDAEGARVDVVMGSVELLAKDGSPVTVTAGEGLRLSGGEVQIIGREAAEPEGGAPEVVMLETVEVTVFADGRSEVRRKGDRRWRRVGGKGQPLAEGDGVRVRRGQSRLALQGSDSRLTLAQGAELTFGTTSREGGVEATSLDLKKGGAGLQLARAQKSRVSVGDLLLESDDGGTFHVQKTRDGVAVTAHAGKLVLRRGAGHKVLQAGQVARVGRGAVEDAAVTDLSTPDLVLPSRTGQRLYQTGLRAALLDWRGKDGAYDVRVAEDPRFDRVILAGRVSRSQLRVDLPRRGALYWEIRDAAGKAVDSGSVLVAPEPRLRDLDRLRNEVPEGPDKTTIYYQDKPPAVTFTYAEEPGAAQYQVAVYRQGELQKPVAERKVAALAAALEAGVLAEGSYLWSVTPLAAAGEALRGGRMNKLDLVYDNSVRALLIRAPANGQRVGKEVRTHGVAPVGSRLYINGREVALDEKSRFDLPVTPTGRPSLIIYRLVRPDAADALYVRMVKRGGR